MFVTAIGNKRETNAKQEVKIEEHDHTRGHEPIGYLHLTDE